MKLVTWISLFRVCHNTIQYNTKQYNSQFAPNTQKTLKTRQDTYGRGCGGSRNIIEFGSLVLHKIDSVLTHFQSFSSFKPGYMHPFDMNLTSTTPRQIIPRLEDSVFRLGTAHPACSPNSESSISRSEGYFQGFAALPYFHQTRFNLFPFAFSNLRTYLIFMGQSSTSFNHIWAPSLYFIPFTPPPPP